MAFRSILAIFAIVKETKTRRSPLKKTLWLVSALLFFWLAGRSYIAICIDKGRRVNMEHLAEGIIHYNDSHGRLPRSLAELTSDNFLPVRSEIYACPVQNGRFFLLPSVDLTNMQYDIDFNDTNIIVRFRPRVLALCAWLVRAEDLSELHRMIGPNEHGMRFSTPKHISDEEFKEKYIREATAPR